MRRASGRPGARPGTVRCGHDVLRHFGRLWYHYTRDEGMALSPNPIREDIMSTETYIVIVESGASLKTEVREMVRTFFDHKLRTCTRVSPKISSPDHKCNNGDEVYSFDTTLPEVVELGESADSGSIYLYRVEGKLELPKGAKQLEDADGLVALLSAPDEEADESA